MKIQAQQVFHKRADRSVAPGDDDPVALLFRDLPGQFRHLFEIPDVEHFHLGIQFFLEQFKDLVDAGRVGREELFARIAVEKDKDLFELLYVHPLGRFHTVLLSVPPDAAVPSSQPWQAARTWSTVRSVIQRP